MASPWRPLLVLLKKKKSHVADVEGVAIVDGLSSERGLRSDRCLLLRCHPCPHMVGREEVLSSDPISRRAVARQANGVKAGSVSERRVTSVSVVPCRLHGEVAYRLEGAAVGAHSIPHRVGETYHMVQCHQMGCYPGPQEGGTKKNPILWSNRLQGRCQAGYVAE